MNRFRFILAAALAASFLQTGARADNPPRWAVGAFRGASRKYDLDVELRIYRDGAVTRSAWKRSDRRQDADTDHGNWDHGELVFGRDRFYVNRGDGGFRLEKKGDKSDVTSFRYAGGPDSPRWERDRRGDERDDRRRDDRPRDDRRRDNRDRRPTLTRLDTSSSGRGTFTGPGGASSDVRSVRVELRPDKSARITVRLDREDFVAEGSWTLGGDDIVNFTAMKIRRDSALGGGVVSLRGLRDLKQVTLNVTTATDQKRFRMNFDASR